MSARAESRRRSSVKFALVPKGKSVFVKVSYESLSDMLLAQRAWHLVRQKYQADDDTSAVAGNIHVESELSPASAAFDGESVSSDDFLSALKCIKSPEWHKNGATLRLPDGYCNASRLLTAVISEFESCVQQQLVAAEEEHSVVAPALPPPLAHAAPSPSPSPAVQPLPLVGQEQDKPLHPSTSAHVHAPTAKQKSRRTLPAQLPPGVSLKQIGAAEYYAELPCDNGTMRQIAGPYWRRMVQHLRPRALVERWCRYAHAFLIKGLRDDVIHTVNMLHEEIQRFKTGAGRSEGFEIPHGYCPSKVFIAILNRQRTSACSAVALERTAGAA